jgi:hypothetical protein
MAKIEENSQLPRGNSSIEKKCNKHNASYPSRGREKGQMMINKTARSASDIFTYNVFGIDI